MNETVFFCIQADFAIEYVKIKPSIIVWVDNRVLSFWTGSRHIRSSLRAMYFFLFV